ncbi:hypothetical protein ACFY9A_13385 [Streptomyces rubradiris]
MSTRVGGGAGTDETLPARVTGHTVASPSAVIRAPTGVPRGSGTL